MEGGWCHPQAQLWTDARPQFACWLSCVCSFPFGDKSSLTFTDTLRGPALDSCVSADMSQQARETSTQRGAIVFLHSFFVQGGGRWPREHVLVLAQ